LKFTYKERRVKDHISIYNYMKYFHDDKFTTLKAFMPEIYLRTGMCFRTGSIQFKDNEKKVRAERI
jgi:hypothetical protein